MAKKLTKQSLAAYGIDGVQACVKDAARRLRQIADEIEQLKMPLMPGDNQENYLNELLVLSSNIKVLGESLSDDETAMRQFLEEYHKRG